VTTIFLQHKNYCEVYNSGIKFAAEKMTKIFSMFLPLLEIKLPSFQSC